MGNTDLICMWISELVSLSATMFAFIYGLGKFFKKGKPLFLQSITMAMGCHSLGTVYRLCFILSHGASYSGFSPAYLGQIGFFLFFVAASYGHLDRIVDDGSRAIRPCRYVAVIASLCAAVLIVPNMLTDRLPISAKVSVVLVWIPATVSVYYNLKHAIIPDYDFGFVRAIKPYSVCAMCLGFAELLYTGAWNFNSNVFLLAASVIFAILCIVTMIVAQKGAKKWTI